MTIQSNLQEISLAKLVVWNGNVRKTGVTTGLDELTASIAAHGLLNPLTVTHGPKGKFPVIAGQRRLLALKALAKSGIISKAHPVACVLRDEEGDPAELSLAENVVRIAMHPADQFIAWRGLVEQGSPVPEIAARFGVAESTVRKRLALARVSPIIFALYREGALSLEVLQAFTVSDDHALQESVWQSLSEWEKDNSSAVRRALTATEISCSDKRVKLIGLDAYEAAGGSVRRDLFDPKEGGFVQDAALLDRLVRERLEAAADTVRSEVWLWTEIHPAFTWEQRHAFTEAEPDILPLSDALEEEIAALEAEAEAMDGEEADAQRRFRTIQQRLCEIDAARQLWSEEIKGKAGAIIHLAYDGTIAIERGLIRAEDASGIVDEAEEAETEAPAPERDAAPAMSSALIEELTAIRTAALRAELAREPAMALALTVHAMALSAFYHAPRGVLKAWVTARSLRPSIRDYDACPAVIAFEAERTRIQDLLPAEADDLWGWCLNALQADLLDVLAVATAHGLDAVVSKSDPNRDGRSMGDTLSAALGIAMSRWYTPTAQGYFGRIGKAAILADLAEARQAPCAPAWEKMKKADLAALAEREVAATGWLPALLR